MAQGLNNWTTCSKPSRDKRRQHCALTYIQAHCEGQEPLALHHLKAAPPPPPPPPPSKATSKGSSAASAFNKAEPANKHLQQQNCTLEAVCRGQARRPNRGMPNNPMVATAPQQKTIHRRTGSLRTQGRPSACAYCTATRGGGRGTKTQCHKQQTTPQQASW
jgi:hypothetical protein